MAGGLSLLFKVPSQLAVRVRLTDNQVVAAASGTAWSGTSRAVHSLCGLVVIAPPLMAPGLGGVAGPDAVMMTFSRVLAEGLTVEDGRALLLHRRVKQTHRAADKPAGNCHCEALSAVRQAGGRYLGRAQDDASVGRFPAASAPQLASNRRASSEGDPGSA